MSFWSTDNHFDEPSPELLAAYLDGEFEGCDALIERKEFIEAWLRDHPEAMEQLLAYRRLKQLWHETTPAVPEIGTWQSFLHSRTRIATKETTVANRSFRNLRGLVVITCAAVFLLAIVLTGYWQWERTPDRKSYQDGLVDVTNSKGVSSPSLDLEPLMVASSEEVEILQIHGQDTDTLVIGALPVEGELVLAAPGDVIITAQTVSDKPGVRLYDDPPMIWAYLQGD